MMRFAIFVKREENIMKKNNYKSCNRKNCPYYEYKVCPCKDKCDYSRDALWSQKK